MLCAAALLFAGRFFWGSDSGDRVREPDLRQSPIHPPIVKTDGRINDDAAPRSRATIVNDPGLAARNPGAEAGAAADAIAIVPAAPEPAAARQGEIFPLDSLAAAAPARASTPPQLRSVPAGGSRAASKRQQAPPSGDMDIDILAALLAHVDAAKSSSAVAAAPAQKSAPQQTPFESLLLPLEERLRACPKANTLEGINCRETVCSSYWGKDPACPAPAKSADKD